LYPDDKFVQDDLSFTFNPSLFGGLVPGLPIETMQTFWKSRLALVLLLQYQLYNVLYEGKGKGWVLALTRVRLATRSALQSRKWQLTGMS